MPSYRTMRVRMHRRAQRRDPNALPIILTAILIVALVVLISSASRFLKDIAGDMAISNATDIITATINKKIFEKMSEGQYNYDYFVTLQRDNNGDISAISANMTRINALSSEILREVIDSTSGGEIDLSVPIGNLTGSNLLLGRGPHIPIKILLLTSSFADFRNEITSAGINQTKHQIILEITIQIDVLLPWSIKQANIPCEVLIAETVIVGKVPNTYLNMDTAGLNSDQDGTDQIIGTRPEDLTDGNGNTHGIFKPNNSNKTN